MGVAVCGTARVCVLVCVLRNVKTAIFDLLFPLLLTHPFRNAAPTVFWLGLLAVNEEIRGQFPKGRSYFSFVFFSIRKIVPCFEP